MASCGHIGFLSLWCFFIENFTNMIIGTLVLLACFGKKRLRKSAILGLMYGMVLCLKIWKIWRCFKVGIEVGVLNIE